MAGLPDDLIERAREILASFEDRSLPVLEETFRRSSEIIEEIEEIASLDIGNTTPLQALLKLSELKEKLSELRRRGICEM